MSVTPQKSILILFRQLSAGNLEAALWDLHARYFHRLKTFVVTIVHLKEAAEEITNDVFIDIWQKRHLLGSINDPEMYLFVCAKNKALRHLGQKTIPAGSFDELEEFECVTERDPCDMLISSEMLKIINGAIRDLPPKCRVIFRLVKENNLKYREVAKLLDISEKTVENQIGIALKKLSASISFRFA